MKQLRLFAHAVGLLLITLAETSATSPFKTPPRDMIISGPEPIIIPCVYKEPVRDCTWWKQDWLLSFFNEEEVFFAGNRSAGDCSLKITVPQPGKHTTTWHCSVTTMDGKRAWAKEIRIFTREYRRITNYDNFNEYNLMYVVTKAANERVITLESRTPYDDVRIRWFVDQVPVPAKTRMEVDVRDPKKNKVYSSITVRFDNPNENPIKTFYCAIEFKENYLFYKKHEVYTGSIVTDHFYLSKLTEPYDEHLPKINPKPQIFLDGKLAPNFGAVDVIAEYPNLHEVEIICDESTIFPHSILQWEVYAFESEAVSEYTEFNTSWQVMAESEKISLHGIMLHRQSSITVRCVGYDIFKPRISRTVAKTDFNLKWVTSFESENNQSPFLEEPGDVELFGTRPVVLPCRVNQTISSCWWYRNGGEIVPDDHTYLIAENKGIGDCRLHILRPKIAVDTTYWQCVVELKRTGKSVQSKLARVLVRNFQESNESFWKDDQGDQKLISVDTNSSDNSKLVTLESKTQGDTRIRWFINGRIATATNTVIDTVDLSHSVIRSTLTVPMKTEEHIPMLVQFCLEKRSDIFMKSVDVGAIYGQ